MFRQKVFKITEMLFDYAQYKQMGKLLQFAKTDDIAFGKNM